MPSLLYYLRRVGEQPFRETVNQAFSLASDRAGSLVQPVLDNLFAKDPTPDELLKSSGATSLTELTDRLKTRDWPDLPLDMPDAPEAAEGLLGRMSPWHIDFASGYVWDSTVHARKLPLAPGPGIDIKGPWELSRCHDLVTLGLAYRETADERFAAHAVATILDWIEKNPPRTGVNWMSAMEAGIRAVNWCWAFALIRPSATVDERFSEKLLLSLSTHATFIHANLEFREASIAGRKARLNSNHYLCDLAGLLSIGMLFPELGLQKHAAFAASEFKKELAEQVAADGVDYEHSTAYHQFVMEIFTYAFHLMGEPQPNGLKRMRAFAEAALQPDGTLVQVGDNDSGRLLPPFKLDVAAGRHSAIFPHSSFFSLHGAGAHTLISAARVGMRGMGSHSHNDLLSFTFYFGRPWIVDPGTFAYLPNIEARNWFRSTAAHNTVRVDQQEIRTFHREAIFQMVDAADVRVLSWENSTEMYRLAIEHTGYERLARPVRHERRFELSKTTPSLVVDDTIHGKGRHQLEWFLQIHPDVTVEREADGFMLVVSDSRVRIRMEVPGAELSTVPGWYSPAYGVRSPATTIVARATVKLPFSAMMVIEPC